MEEFIMRVVRLGKTNLKVTELCFGTLPMGPLQANLSLDKGIKLIQYAFEKGVNYVDTAATYGTCRYIKKAIRGQKRKDIFISSKSSAESYLLMKNEIERSLEELDTDYLDIFFLHVPGSEIPFQKNDAALQCLLDFKRKGLIKAVGISTHYVKVANKAAEKKDIDVIFTIINSTGQGIVDGTIDEMLASVKSAHSKGKGIVAMKALAGGILVDDVEKSFNFVRKKSYIDIVAVGFINKAELDVAFHIFGEKKIKPELIGKINKRQKKIRIISSICQKCGECVIECPNNALLMEYNNIKILHARCIRCGYCIRVCPEFCIRLA